MRYPLLRQKVRVAVNVLRKRPILTVFDVTKLCNQRCPMCNVWKTESQDMSLGEIRAKAEELRRFGVGYVFLQGGDPLLRNDIIDIIDIFLENGIRPTVISNGIRLKPEIARAIAQRPCNLTISIDSMIPERYHTLRGVDTLELVKKNLDAATGPDFAHKGNWSITTTVTKMTELSDVKDIMRFAYDHHMMFAVRPYITVSGKAGKKDENLTYQYDDVLDIFEYMLKRARKENLFAALIYEEHIRYIKGGTMPECDALNYSFLMKETGEIAPCIELPDLNVDLRTFDKDKARHKPTLDKCNQDTPCFYNNAREVGLLWRNKFRVLAHIPTVIWQMKRYGNFF